MSDRGAMDTELIRAPGHGLELEKGRIDSTLYHPKTRFRMLAAFLDAPALLFREPADRRGNNAVVLIDNSINQRKILFLDELPLELPGKGAMRTNRFCDDDETGRLFVETMDKAGADDCGLRIADCGLRWATFQKCIRVCVRGFRIRNPRSAIRDQRVQMKHQ